jgi:hypothetical protein
MHSCSSVVLQAFPSKVVYLECPETLWWDCRYIFRDWLAKGLARGTFKDWFKRCKVLLKRCDVGEGSFVQAGPSQMHAKLFYASTSPAWQLLAAVPVGWQYGVSCIDVLQYPKFEC